jgi:hypothetical protein
VGVGREDCKGKLLVNSVFFWGWALYHNLELVPKENPFALLAWQNSHLDEV